MIVGNVTSGDSPVFHCSQLHSFLMLQFINRKHYPYPIGDYTQIVALGHTNIRSFSSYGRKKPPKLRNK